jgi:hypothetical protein
MVHDPLRLWIVLVAGALMLDWFRWVQNVKSLAVSRHKSHLVIRFKNRDLARAL